MNLLYKIAGMKRLEEAAEGKLKSLDSFDAVEQYAPTSLEKVSQAGAFEAVPSAAEPSRDRGSAHVGDENHNGVSIDQAWRQHKGFESEADVTTAEQAGPTPQ